MSWNVKIKRKLDRKLKTLPFQIQCLFLSLVKDLENNGPEQPTWKNYSKLGENKYHCHLTYSYVACWTKENESITIEVYYVGSREKAPY